MIETQSTYIHERQFIFERLNNNKENQIMFATALQRNTEVMNELKVQLATLGKTLEHRQLKMDLQYWHVMLLVCLVD